MTSLLAERHVGPRWRSVPRVASSAGSEAVELAASAGLVLDPWQAAFLADALGEREDGRWAALEVGLICPRQNGKGSVLEARELAGLFLFDEQLILHSAHEFKTASEAYRRIRYLIESTPDLDRRVFKFLQNNNDMSIELMGGQRLRFVARSTGSGRGFTGDTVILDEAYNLSSEAVAALFPTLSARPNPQLWYTSSAPMQTAPSAVLRRFCRRGRVGGPLLTYVEYAADLGCDPKDPDAWAEANPAMSVGRITEEFCALEFEALGDEFPRERLGHWNDDENAGARVIPREVWAAGLDSLSGPVGQVQFALDVSPARDMASFAVAGMSGRGGTHVELVDHEPGTEWLVARAKELQSKWGGALGVSAGSPAASLLPELEAAGVRVIEISNGDHAQACGRFYDAAMQGQLKHLGQPMLTVAVDGADRKFYGDAWLWSRRASTVDISPLVAVTLAKWLHDQAPPPASGFVDLADYDD